MRKPLMTRCSHSLQGTEGDRAEHRLPSQSRHKSLDASGGSVFRNLFGAAKGALIRAAASTQPFAATHINGE